MYSNFAGNFPAVPAMISPVKPMNDLAKRSEVSKNRLHGKTKTAPRTAGNGHV